MTMSGNARPVKRSPSRAASAAPLAWSRTKPSDAGAPPGIGLNGRAARLRRKRRCGALRLESSDHPAPREGSRRIGIVWRGRAPSARPWECILLRHGEVEPLRARLPDAVVVRRRREHLLQCRVVVAARGNGECRASEAGGVMPSIAAGGSVDPLARSARSPAAHAAVHARPSRDERSAGPTRPTRRHASRFGAQFPLRWQTRRAQAWTTRAPPDDAQRAARNAALAASGRRRLPPGTSGVAAEDADV